MILTPHHDMTELKRVMKAPLEMTLLVDFALHVRACMQLMHDGEKHK
jgi:hypothetical protein